ncbi:MAG: ornithine carbamoyltransferase [Candidatus Aenigmarchaeota archaeon]
MVRHLLTLKDYTGEEIKTILNKAIEIKKNPEDYRDVLKGKYGRITLIMLFQKTSTRTRLSFEDGMGQLGGHAIFVDWRTTQFKIADIRDETRAMERYADIIMARLLKHETLMKMVKAARTPIINGLCERYHPCQALGDVLTMIEKSGGSVDSLKGKKVVWLGIGNNVSNSLVMACTKLGAKITLCIAEKDKAAYDKELEDQAKATSLYEETTDLRCVKDADFVYTDSWINMEFFDDDGNVKEDFKEEIERRKEVFLPYQLSKALLDKYKSNAKIMHNMPCHPPYEITRDAIDHPNSIIFDQAENRLHIQKAIILHLLESV